MTTFSGSKSCAGLRRRTASFRWNDARGERSMTSGTTFRAGSDTLGSPETMLMTHWSPCTPLLLHMASSAYPIPNVKNYIFISIFIIISHANVPHWLIFVSSINLQRRKSNLTLILWHFDEPDGKEVKLMIFSGLNPRFNRFIAVVSIETCANLTINFLRPTLMRWIVSNTWHTCSNA